MGKQSMWQFRRRKQTASEKALSYSKAHGDGGRASGATQSAGGGGMPTARTGPCGALQAAVGTPAFVPDELEAFGRLQAGPL